MKIMIISRMWAIFWVALFFSSINLRAQDGPFEYGSGSQRFPYEVSTAAQLVELAKLVNEGNPNFNKQYYRLMANIDLSAYGSGYNGGKGWIPIGHSDEKPFMGHFDGNNKIISNLYINNSTTGTGKYDNTGLFGWLNGGSVKNLRITGVNIAGNEKVGGIAGFVSYNSVTVTAGEIVNCSIAGTVTGAGNTVGGMAGGIQNGRITNSYVTGTVTGKNRVGGIAGYGTGGSVIDCAALHQSVKATDAGAEIARIVCTQTGMGATSLSGNIAFDEMTITSNNVPKTVLNNGNGVDGLNKSALQLNAASNFPAGLSAAPWTFVAGKLPGLGAAVTKPDYLMAIWINLDILKDGVIWLTHGKKFTIKLSTDETITQTMELSYMSLSAVVKRSGIWKVYEGNTYTGANITTSDATGAGKVNYYTVAYDVYDAGMAKGSSISAKYDGNNIASGAVVLSGKQLVITATGAGASTYAYTWRGTGTSNQTTASITIPFLQSRINAECTVTTTHKVTFTVVNGNGTLNAMVDNATITSGALVTYGKNVVFSTSPNKGYTVKQWKDNNTVPNGTNPGYTINNLIAEHDVSVEYELCKYKVTFGVTGQNGSISASSGITSGMLVQHGTKVTFTAEPATGSDVKEWKEANGKVVNGTNATYTVTIEGELDIMVAFELFTYRVNFSVAGGTGGALTAKVGNTAIASGDYVAHGSNIEFTAKAAANFQVAGWTDGGAINGKEETYIITNITAAHTVSVAFEPIQHAVTFNVTGGSIGGTLKATDNGKPINSGASVLQGNTVVFTAIPNANYRIKGWGGDATVVMEVNSRSLTVTAAHTVTVEFELVSYVVKFEALGGNGTLTSSDGSAINSGALVQHGKNVVFTATGNTGYVVKQWKDNGVIVTPTNPNSYTVSGITEDHTVTVEFESASTTTYTVNFSPAGKVTATVDGAPINSGDQVKNGRSIMFIASPNANEAISGWTNNGTAITPNSINCYTLTNLQSNVNVVVSFQTGTPTYAAVFGVTGGNGSLVARLGGNAITSPASVATGGNVVFTASPENGYRVKEWKHNGSSFGKNTNEWQLTINATAIVTVEFERDIYPVSFSSEGDGTLTAMIADGGGISSGQQVLKGRSVVFTANPATGNQVSWIRNNQPQTVNANTYTIVVGGEETVKALFGGIAIKVEYSVENNTGGAIKADVANGEMVVYGREVQFTAEPLPYYRVKEWRNNGVLVPGNDICKLNITAPALVTVAFEPIMNEVTFSVRNGNGTISAVVDNKPVTMSPVDVWQGSSIEFTAIPNAGYQVLRWMSGGAPVQGNTTNSYTLNNPANPTEVTVEFEVATYVIEFSKTGSGSLTAKDENNTPILSGDRVLHGSTVIFTATPSDEDFHISGWKDNQRTVNGSNSVYTLNGITESHNITVVFKGVTYPVTFIVVNGNGSIAAKENDAPPVNISPAEFEKGSNIVFEATPNPGYRVKEWTDNGTVLATNQKNYPVNYLDREHFITVEFEIALHEVTFSVKGSNGSLMAKAGDVTDILSGAAVPEGMSVVFTAVPDEGYRVKEWSITVNNTTTIEPGDPTSKHTLTLTGATNVMVEFEIIPVVIITDDLPDGIVDIDYREIIIFDSETPVTWSMVSGSLPEGLDFSDNGIISGIPVKAGTFTFTIKGQNNIGYSTKQLIITIEKGAGKAVSAPAVKSKTHTSITMNPVTAPIGQTVEYAISKSNSADVESLTWQDGLIFDGLIANTSYYVYARSKGNNDYFTGPASVSAAIVTEASTSSGSDLQVNPLKAYVQGGRLFVRGLSEGKTWSVYSASGMLMYRGKAVSSDMEIALTAQGVLIVQSEEWTVKVAYYGQ